MNTLPSISHRLLVAAVAQPPADRRKPEVAPKPTVGVPANALTLTLEVLTGGAARGVRALRRSVA